MLILFFICFYLCWYTLLYICVIIPHSRHVRTQFKLQSNIEISRIDVLGVLDGNMDLQRRIV